MFTQHQIQARLCTLHSSPLPTLFALLSSLPHSAFCIHSIWLYSLFSTLYILTSALCTLNPLHFALRSIQTDIHSAPLLLHSASILCLSHSDCNTFHSGCYTLTLSPLRILFSRTSSYYYTLHCAALTIALFSLLLCPLNSHSALCILIDFAVFSRLYSAHSELSTSLDS